MFEDNSDDDAEEEGEEESEEESEGVSDGGYGKGKKVVGRYKYNYEADELSDIEDDLDSDEQAK